MDNATCVPLEYLTKFGAFCRAAQTGSVQLVVVKVRGKIMYSMGVVLPALPGQPEDALRYEALALIPPDGFFEGIEAASPEEALAAFAAKG